MVERKFILPDGTIVDKLSPEMTEQFRQKIIDLLTPLAYEAIMNELSAS